MSDELREAIADTLSECRPLRMSSRQTADALLADPLAALLAERDDLAAKVAAVRAVVDELRQDERDDIPPHVPLLIEALAGIVGDPS